MKKKNTISERAIVLPLMMIVVILFAGLFRKEFSFIVKDQANKFLFYIPHMEEVFLHEEYKCVNSYPTKEWRETQEENYGICASRVINSEKIEMKDWDAEVKKCEDELNNEFKGDRYRKISSMCPETKYQKWISWLGLKLIKVE